MASLASATAWAVGRIVPLRQARLLRIGFLLMKIWTFRLQIIDASAKI